MPDPIPVRVLRHLCPFCRRSHSRPSRTREHMARCWFNPDARGCKTCKHFEPQGWESGDDCAAGVNLEGRPECTRCLGAGHIYSEKYAREQCPECEGDGAEVKPGPIVHCEHWEPRPDGSTDA